MKSATLASGFCYNKFMSLFSLIALTISGIWSSIFLGLTIGFWHTDFWWVYLTFLLIGTITFIIFVVIHFMTDD